MSQICCGKHSPVISQVHFTTGQSCTRKQKTFII